MKTSTYHSNTSPTVKIILFLIVSFTLTTTMSCSFFLQQSKTEQEKLSRKPLDTFKDESVCSYPQRKKNSLIGQHHGLQKSYIKFLDILRQNKISLQFIDHVVLWSLLQMNVRPDQSSPTSRLQVMLQNKGSYQFWDFSLNLETDQKSQLVKLLEKKKQLKDLYSLEKKEIDKNKEEENFLTEKSVHKNPSPYPFFYGLDQLIKHYKGQRNLLQLAELLEKYFPSPLLVEETFAQFLSQHSLMIEKDATFLKYYFKDDEVLQKNERFPTIPYRRLVLDFYKNLPSFLQKNTYAVNKKLYDYHLANKDRFHTLNPSLKVECSLDLNLYKNNLNMGHDKILDEHVFGFQSSQGDFFLASTYQNINAFKSIFDTPLFSGVIGPNQSTLCLINNQKLNYTISTIINNSRDSGQIMYHFLKKNMSSVKNISDFMNLMHKPRYLFFINPVRLSYESDRGGAESLQELLTLDIPLYYQSVIGQFWSHFYQQDRNDYGFVVDQRLEGKVSCF